MNLRMRITCLPALLALMGGALGALPAMAQQAQQDAEQTTAQQSKATSKTEVATTQDDLRERILLDRIDALEKRIAGMEDKQLQGNSDTSNLTTDLGYQLRDRRRDHSGVCRMRSGTPRHPLPDERLRAHTPAPHRPWSAGPIDFTGEVDGYNWIQHARVFQSRRGRSGWIFRQPAGELSSTTSTFRRTSSA